MGGRGSASGTAARSVGIKGLVDSSDFREFIRLNRGNPEFMAFGRENGTKAVREMWYEQRIQSANIHEMSKEEAIATVREGIADNVRRGWFVNADSDYKPMLMDSVAANPQVYNAGLNIAYRNYAETASNPMSFDKWLRTPQTLYRGDKGQAAIQSDIFMSFTPDRSVAESFGDHITTIRVRPIDTWGSYQTTGEQEFLIPVRRNRRSRG